MKPTGKQIARLQNALLSGYDYHHLRQMVRTQLDQDLESITPVVNATLTEIVVFPHPLVHSAARWTSQTGRAARQENPGNSELARIADELLAVEFELLSQQQWKRRLTPPPKRAIGAVLEHYNRLDFAGLDRWIGASLTWLWTTCSYG